MKTRISIILALIALNIQLVSADNNFIKDYDGPAKSNLSFSFESLAPVTPEEATFEDAYDLNPMIISVPSLAPVTPENASFEEIKSGEEGIKVISIPANQNKVETLEKGRTVKTSCP
jgi:hypothetical protein